MTNYNFSEISDFEFEALCRDLLQADLGISFELFGSGPDQGIDLRYIGVVDNENHTIVGQCKRWAEGSFTKLLSHLKLDELPKIRKLAPSRYILLTSVELNPSRKDRIVSALYPWIKDPSDVIGKQDITGLLARHSEVERRHIKLWLTSAEVLNAFLNSDIMNRSEYALEKIKRQLRLWAPNPSFDRARDILDANHVCVISGAPGIGKTMLANVMSAGYASRGYQLIAISEDIKEGERVWRSDARQIFLYDDFLGQVTYGELQLRKNEQSSLADFLERVRSSDNKRFILTTREYILSEAQLRYENLSNRSFLNSKYVIGLQDYTQFIRAQILYNHLFFSELPAELKTALIPNQKYWDVIRHRNYNPRVIEYAVSLPGVDSLSPDEFVSNIFSTLDDPSQVWEVIFRNLPDMARRILLAISSLPTQVFLEDLQRAVESLSPGDFDADRFRNALDMVDGTFVDVMEGSPGPKSRQLIVVIRNPSVRDYLWARLETFDGEADVLLKHAIFFEQCVILYEGQNHAVSMSSLLPPSAHILARDRDVVDSEAVASRAGELLSSSSPVVENWDYGNSRRSKKQSVNLERRTAFLLSILAAHPSSPAIVASASWAIGVTIQAWERGQASQSDALELLKEMKTVEGLLQENFSVKAGRTLLNFIASRLQNSQGFKSLVDLATLLPSLFAQPRRTLESWGSDFEDFLDSERNWLLDDLDDADWLEYEMQSISKIGSAMGIDISELESEAEFRIEVLREKCEPEEEEGLPTTHSEPLEEFDDVEVDALFQSLL